MSDIDTGMGTEKTTVVVKQLDEVEQPKKVVDPEDEKRSGIKEIAQNPEVMIADKNLPIDKPVAKPSFFVKKSSRHNVVLDVLSAKDDGRIVSISKTGLGINFDQDFPFLVHTELVFEFSIPNYEDMSTYRQRSGVYRREAQQVIVDKSQLRNFLLVWHLKAWNLTDDDGNKIDLNFDANGSMSEESIAIVYSLSPTLLDVIMTVFEKDILLT